MMNDMFEINLDDNCTFVVRCRDSRFGSYSVTVDPGFSDTLVPYSSSTSVMLTRTNCSMMMYHYTVQASDGCLEVVIQGTIHETGTLFIYFT